MTTDTNITPKVWIGCLVSYNAGRLIGEWVEASDLDEMQECQKRVAAQAVAAAKEAGEYPVYFGEPEEFFLADNEGFGGFIGEYTPLETVAEIAEAIEEHGAPFLAFLSIEVEADVAEVIERFQERYAGEFESMEDFAREHVEECGWGGVPSQKVTISEWPKVEVNPIEELAPYLDFEMIARDLASEYTEADGFIFRSWS
jgi:antirestriction protein